MKKVGVLLVNLGTPNSPKTSDVRSYLFQFLNDKRVIDLPYLIRKLLVNLIIVPFRAPKSAKVYKDLWTDKGSPIIYYTQSLTEKLQKSLGDIPDQKLTKHLDEFFSYVDSCIETSLRLPIHEDLSEMRDLLKELHGGWLHLVSPMRGRALEEPLAISGDATIGH